jgi:hypothetical protein
MRRIDLILSAEGRHILHPSSFILFFGIFGAEAMPS